MVKEPVLLKVTRPNSKIIINGAIVIPESF